MKKYSYKTLMIEDLYVNPENYRYVNEVQDEIKAIIAMFEVPSGEPKKEMVNLAKDIIEDGLNPFEMPIVSYDDSIGKYIVYDGNRRITCIKLMTQYKNESEILKEIPTVAEIYKLEYSGDDEIQCVVYEEADDAIHFLNKIHNDINNGIGRKQWDSYAKMKANAATGNKSKAYAIVEFVRNNPKTDQELLALMAKKKWISKLERVVGFARFKDVYKIQFDNRANMSYLDTEEYVLKMMSKLIYDLINNSATDNFRFKSDFEKYTESLDSEFKSKVHLEEKVKNDEKTVVKIENTVSGKLENTEVKTESAKVESEENRNEVKKSVLPEEKKIQNTINEGTGKPVPIPKQHAETKEALALYKEYKYSDYTCLNEKGTEFLVELLSLNVKQYPAAAVALCRCVLEYTLKLWMQELGGGFDSSKLPSTYNGCVNLLRKHNIIDNKEHSVLTTLVNKEDFITLLNTWMHADTEACVSETPLVSGWKNVRLLVEKYLDTH